MGTTEFDILLKSIGRNWNNQDSSYRITFSNPLMESNNKYSGSFALDHGDNIISKGKYTLLRTDEEIYIKLNEEKYDAGYFHWNAKGKVWNLRLKGVDKEF